MIMKTSAQTSVSTRANKASAFRRNRLAAAIGIAGAMLVAGMSGSVLAAKGGTPGKPTDGGGMAPPDYGDLIIIKRDTNGVPELDANSCWQPIAFHSDTCALEDGDTVPVDPDTCAVLQPTCTREVDFGRINEARSPETVFQSQLDDAVIKLATAQCRSLDPAGRLVAKTDVDATTTVGSTIDSPLQNLAIYRELMMKQSIGTPLPPGSDDPLTTAARALGAASDKSGGVNVDMVAYLNQIMGLTELNVSFLPRNCQDRKQEVKGVVQLVEECFLDYSSYVYVRGDNFDTTMTSLPNPSYIPDENGHGQFEYLYELSEPNTFGIMQGPILNAVFPDGAGGYESGYTGGDIGGFAQAADDARAVIDFMHSNPIPAGYETPLTTCEAGGTPPSEDPQYDVSISEVSGLQVPVQIVDGSEGREFTVTVANAGPDAATGSVTVTAVSPAGEINGSPWTYDFTIVAGGSQSFTEFFSINFGEKTTITWTAEAYAEFDLPTNNNEVTATSSVKVTGSGGGGGGPGGPASASGRSGK